MGLDWTTREPGEQRFPWRGTKPRRQFTHPKDRFITLHPHKRCPHRCPVSPQRRPPARRLARRPHDIGETAPSERGSFQDAQGSSLWVGRAVAQRGATALEGPLPRGQIFWKRGGDGPDSNLAKHAAAAANMLPYDRDRGAPI